MIFAWIIVILAALFAAFDLGVALLLGDPQRTVVTAAKDAAIVIIPYCLARAVGGIVADSARQTQAEAAATQTRLLAAIANHFDPPISEPPTGSADDPAAVALESGKA